MRDRFPLVLIGFLVLLGSLGSFLLDSARRGAFADPLSTFRSARDGARGLYLLLEDTQLPVARQQESLEVLERGRGLALLGVRFAEAGDARPSRTGFSRQRDGGLDDGDDEGLTDEEREEFRHRGFNALRAPPVGEEEGQKLIEHLRNGATVLYVPATAAQDPLLDAVGVHLTKAEKALDVRTLAPAQPTRWTTGVERVEAKVVAFLDLPDDALPLLVDEQLDLIAAAAVPYGQGRLVVITAPELAMNQALGRADNAQFWKSVVREATRPGPLAFDEFHHGFTAERSMGAFAARYGLQFAAGQLLLGVIAWAAALRRFGRPRAPAEESRIAATDVLSATSRLYREGRHHGHAAGVIARQLAAELARVAAVSPRASPTDVSAALEARGRSALAHGLLDVTRLAHAAAHERDVFEVARKAALVRTHLATPAPKRKPA